VINWGQVLFNSVVTGSLYFIATVGLTSTYGLSRFPNVAHAEFVTLGAFLGYLVTQQLGWGYPFGILAALLGSGIVGVLSYRGIFEPLAKRGATMIHLAIASIGLGLVLRHIMGQIWGWAPLSYRVTWASFDIGPVRVTGLWLWIILAALVLAGVMHFMLTQTKLGKAIRATSFNPDLALASGINISRVTLTTWFMGAALAGVAGLFKGAMAKIDPLLGWEILLPAFAVTILGGVGSFYGAIAAAYIIGFAENIGVVFLANLGISTEYRMAIAFVILILTLIFRPRGLARSFGGT